MKKGLSPVIATFMLVVFSIAAVGIVWVAINSVVSNEARQISSGLEKLFLDIQIESARIEDNSIIVTVKRNQGDGVLTGINFIFSDGSNAKIIEKTAGLKELERGTFIFSKEEFSGLEEIKDVSIAPVILSGSREEMGNIAETKQIESFTGRELIIID